MNTLLLAITAAALVVLVALMLRPVQNREPRESAEDARITPLLRGINFLLSDEPDRALQEMVQVARLRSEAADVYMALGEMFRSKGEIGRAVRIHQNLLARPDLPRSMYLQVHLALATDFQTGGLLDRALRQYQQALNLQPDHTGALEACLRIREQSSEWVEAEELLTRLEQVRQVSYSSHRAYLFSEMAAGSSQNKDAGNAKKYAARALELDASCAPARMVEIEGILQGGNFKQAEASIRTFWQLSSEHFPLLVPCIIEHASFYNKIGRELLLELWGESHDSELLLAWLECIVRLEGREKAAEFSRERAYVPDSLRASLRLAALTGVEQDAHSRFARQWRKTAKNYTCDACGVEVAEMRWQCPQCHAWGSMHPKREEKI